MERSKQIIIYTWKVTGIKTKQKVLIKTMLFKPIGQKLEQTKMAMKEHFQEQLHSLQLERFICDITNDFTDMIKVVKDQFPKPTV